MQCTDDTYLELIMNPHIEFIETLPKTQVLVVEGKYTKGLSRYPLTF